MTFCGEKFKTNWDVSSAHEITLLHKTLEYLPYNVSVKKIVGDKAYYSDKRDKKLLKKGIELIALHKKNLHSPTTQDGRKLKSYKKRWNVQRFFAWLKPARRILNRFDKKITFNHSLTSLSLKIIKHDLRERFCYESVAIQKVKMKYLIP